MEKLVTKKKNFHTEQRDFHFNIFRGMLNCGNQDQIITGEVK